MDNPLKIYNDLLVTIKEKNAAFCVLIDPDKSCGEELLKFASLSKELGVDVLLAGSSLVLNNSFHETVKLIKESTELPVILFPGGADQVTPDADAILFMSLISGRNPNFLFGDHVIAAPSVHRYNIEPIATGYMLIESGNVSTTEYISDTRPIPRNKPEIAVAHALAAKYLGMKMIYLEAGSGAMQTVPNEIIAAVKQTVGIPVIVGGGITTPEVAAEKVDAGADIIVIGNTLENNWDPDRIRKFSNAIHNG